MLKTSHDGKKFPLCTTTRCEHFFCERLKNSVGFLLIFRVPGKLSNLSSILLARDITEYSASKSIDLDELESSYTLMTIKPISSCRRTPSRFIKLARKTLRYNTSWTWPPRELAAGREKNRDENLLISEIRPKKKNNNKN